MKKARDGTFIRLSSVTSEFISGGGEVGSWAGYKSISLIIVLTVHRPGTQHVDEERLLTGTKTLTIAIALNRKLACKIERMTEKINRNKSFGYR